MSQPMPSGPSVPPATRPLSPVRVLLLSTGILSTLLGVLGIFLPLLPTVPLLLLAAACFVRSSERCHRWLLGHARLGPLIAGFLDGRGIPRRAKLRAIALVWLTISFSALWLVTHPWLKGLLPVVALAVSLYLWGLPERSEDVLPGAGEDEPQRS